MKEKNIKIMKNETSGRLELTINGLPFTAVDDDIFEIPVSILAGINTNNFPKNIVIAPTVDSTVLERPYLNFQISNLDNGKVLVKFFHCFTTDEIIHSQISYPMYQETLAELLLFKTEFNPEITANYYDIENQTFHLHCSIELNADNILNIINETEDYFYSFAELVLKNNNEKLRTFFRNEFGLDPQPSESAKLKYLL